MAYTKVNWAAGVTPLSEANMDHLETQYDELIALFNAHTILMAVNDNDPAALAVAASRIIGRKAAGNIGALTGAEILAILSGQAGADFSMNSKRITNLLAPNAAGHALRKGTRVTIAELPVLTTGKVWKGAAGVPAEASIFSAGTYSGNDSANRAIPHGLGVTPKLVHITQVGRYEQYWIYDGDAVVKFFNPSTQQNLAVTAMNSTNFYVGNATHYAQSANGTGLDFRWLALG